MYRLTRKQPTELDRETESLLERVITEKIARDQHIRPEEVTPEYIHEWRKKNLYPYARVTLTTKYGGYQGTGRRVLTGEEVLTQREQAEEFLRQFSNKE
jgi:hypothetical protein